MSVSASAAPSSQPTSEDIESLYRFLPSIPVCRSSFDLAVSRLPLTILHHSLRTFVYAKWLAEKEGSVYASDDDHLARLFVACICHDFGACHHHDGEQRFEVEGADAASEFLRSNGVSEEQRHDVWVAIALHTSPGIAERIHPMARLVRMAILIDFRPAFRSQAGADELAVSVERDIPRLNIEKVLGDAVVEQAVRRPDKAPPASWPGILLRSHRENPGWEGVNKAF